MAAYGAPRRHSRACSKSGTVANLHLVDIKTIKIALPDLTTQQAIVAEIEAEQALLAANRELIKRMEKKNPYHPRSHLERRGIHYGKGKSSSGFKQKHRKIHPSASSISLKIFYNLLNVLSKITHYVE